MAIEEYKIIDKVLDFPFQNKEGRKFCMGSYRTSHNGVSVDHALIYKGNIINPKEPIFFRINSACYTSDIFGDYGRCDCNWQFEKALEVIDKNGGLIIYHFHHEGRAFGLTDKIKSLKVLESEGKPIWETSIQIHGEMDYRRYNSTIAILNDLGIKKVKLMTNSVRKKEILESCGIEVVELMNLVNNDPILRGYLSAKRDILKDMIKFDNE